MSLYARQPPSRCCGAAAPFPRRMVPSLVVIIGVAFAAALVYTSEITVKPSPPASAPLKLVRRKSYAESKDVSRRHEEADRLHSLGSAAGSLFQYRQPLFDTPRGPTCGATGSSKLTVEHLQRVLLFGDSLTAGAYYDEGPHKLTFRTFSWAKVVQEHLRRWYCFQKLRNLHSKPVSTALLDAALERELDAAQKWSETPIYTATKDNTDRTEEWKQQQLNACVASSDVTSRIAVSARGFPGRNSRELSLRLRRLLRKRSPATDPTLVVIMAGTNDIVGLRGDVGETAATIADMHRDVRDVLCLHPRVDAGGADAGNRLHSNDRSRPCGSVALLTPPLNYRVSMSGLGQRMPRGYCEGRNRNPSVAQSVSHRRQQLHRLLLGHAGSGDAGLHGLRRSCLLNWESLGVTFGGGGGPLTNNGSRAFLATYVDDADGSAVDSATAALWSDCLHPTEEGYRRLGGILAAVLWRSANGNVSTVLLPRAETKQTQQPLCLCS